MSTELDQSAGASTAQTLPEAAGRLRALILLGGTVRASRLSRAVGRSLLDLPVDGDRTVLNLWQERAAGLVGASSLGSLPVHVLLDPLAKEPTTPDREASAPVRIERDKAELRGTGGVLRDHVDGYDPDDLILVGNAAQILLEPLATLARLLFEAGQWEGRSGIGIIGHEDGTPGGLMLIARRALDEIRSIGFVDLREQALPTIAERWGVHVVTRTRATGIPVRSLDDYIAALRSYHRRSAGQSEVGDPFAEDWFPSFALVEPGAEVHESARVHDSVVLAGGRVAHDAVVVRSVVCAGVTVRAGRTVTDAIVTADEKRGGRVGGRGGGRQ